LPIGICWRHSNLLIITLFFPKLLYCVSLNHSFGFIIHLSFLLHRFISTSKSYCAFFFIDL
jgi:hypothetical protein